MAQKSRFFPVLFLMFLFCLGLANQTMAEKLQSSTASTTPAYNQSAGGYTQIPSSSQESKVAEMLWEAMQQTVNQTVQKAGGFAKDVGENFFELAKEKQAVKKQNQVVSNFYAAFDRNVSSLRLNAGEYSELRRGVEDIYIEDGTSKRFKLDPYQFREMPQVIKKVHSEMQIKNAKDGTYETIDLDGKVKQRWQFENGKPHGKVITYYGNGEVLYIDTYSKGDKINRKKFDQEGRLEFDQNYDLAAPPIPSQE